MIDYIRWSFRLEYILHTEVHNYERTKDGWGIRALRYEERVKEKGEESILKNCWREKKREGWKDIRQGKGEVL